MKTSPDTQRHVLHAVVRMRNKALPEPGPDGMNPHVWRKFKQAERNMMRAIRIKPNSRERARHWAWDMKRWLERMEAWFESPRV